jgi:nickel-dependent lactate racemase
MTGTYRLPYGMTELAFKLPGLVLPDLILPRAIAAHPNPAEALKEALHAPFGRPSLPQLNSRSRVSVAVLDGSRPAANNLLLPALFEWLGGKGVSASQVALFIASGVHPHPSPAELGAILPEKSRKECSIVLHDPDAESNLLYLGSTSRETPVWIQRGFYESDLRIVLGIIAPHQFEGFSGGVKAAAIGLAGRETIERNHAMMMDPRSRLGSYSENPCRQDVEEIGELCAIELALSIVLNRDGAMVAAFAGQPRAVMEAGIPVCRDSSCVAIAHAYDVVIASAGGHPRDLNLYQAQKALAHAALITRKGGAVILAAACPQGSGSEAFDAAVRSKPSVPEVIERTRREGFHLGAHKAYQIARDATRCRLFLVSEIDPGQVRACLLNHATSIETAWQALHVTGGDLQVALMPHASTTIPLIR